VVNIRDTSERSPVELTVVRDNHRLLSLTNMEENGKLLINAIQAAMSECYLA